MLLALLGLGGCEGIEEDLGIIEVMYGTPSVHYSVKGKVTDEKGNAVKGIEVSVYGNYMENGQLVSRPFMPGDASDEKGSYTKERSSVFGFPSLTIHFKDVDGDANGGSFADDSTTVNITVKDVTNGGAWYRGQAEVEVPTIKLKKK